MRCSAFVLIAGLAGLSSMVDVHADVQPPPPPQQLTPGPISHEDAGFKAIFDGRTLQGWDGDPRYWRIEHGALVGETTEANLPKYNSFIVWQGGEPGDFELKLEYRITATGNSGLQYRSVALPGFKWVLRGYQCDLDGPEWRRIGFDQFAQARGLAVRSVTGQNYEERGRTFLALAGQLTYVAGGAKQRALAELGTAEDMARVGQQGWNRLHVIARGPQLIHIVNDRVMSMVIDDDAANRRMSGKLGMQVHVGPPMKVEFRNIRLRTL